MLYNMETRKVKTDIDCASCKCYNSKEKKCEGIGIVCYPYDPLINTILDPVTGLPIKLEENKND